MMRPGRVPISRETIAQVGKLIGRLSALGRKFIGLSPIVGKVIKKAYGYTFG